MNLPQALSNSVLSSYNFFLHLKQLYYIFGYGYLIIYSSLTIYPVLAARTCGCFISVLESLLWLPNVFNHQANRNEPPLFFRSNVETVWLLSFSSFIDLHIKQPIPVIFHPSPEVLSGQ